MERYKMNSTFCPPRSQMENVRSLPRTLIVLGESGELTTCQPRDGAARKSSTRPAISTHQRENAQDHQVHTKLQKNNAKAGTGMCSAHRSSSSSSAGRACAGEECSNGINVLFQEVAPGGFNVTFLESSLNILHHETCLRCVVNKSMGVGR